MKTLLILTSLDCAGGGGSLVQTECCDSSVAGDRYNLISHFRFTQNLLEPCKDTDTAFYMKWMEDELFAPELKCSIGADFDKDFVKRFGDAHFLTSTIKINTVTGLVKAPEVITYMSL